jgi:dTDP-4-dehydrorhamnose 3,5-epimerase
MQFEDTAIAGVKLVRLQPFTDERGFFARGWCRKEFEAHGLSGEVAQANISFNRSKHTLRGFHYQLAPHQEDKFLRCTRGAVHDVVIDLRPHSPTFKEHISVALTGLNYAMLLVPKGCANAFLTMEDDTEVTYLVSQFYVPGAERGIRWNDPSFGISWPVEPKVISAKDSNWPDFAEEPEFMSMPHELAAS